MAKDKLKDLKMVLVVWDDAFSIGGWKDAISDEEGAGFMVLTLGFIVKKNAKHLFVAQSHEGDTFADVTAIPHGMIRKVVSLS